MAELLVGNTAELERAFGELADDLTITMADGVYKPAMSGAFGLRAAGVDSLTLRAQNRGKVTLHGGGREFGIRVDKCPGFVLDGVGLIEAGHGIRVTNSERVSLLNGWGHSCGAEVINTGYTVNLTVEAWKIRQGRKWLLKDDRERDERDFYRARRHAVYVGSKPKGTVLKLLDIEGMWGQGIYISGSDGVGVATGTKILDCIVKKCHLEDGSNAPGIQFTLADGAEIVRTLVAECRGGITLEQKSKNVALADSTIWQPNSSFASNVMTGSVAPDLTRSLVVGRTMGPAPVVGDDFSQVHSEDPGELVDAALRSLWPSLGWRIADLTTPPTDDLARLRAELFARERELAELRAWKARVESAVAS